MRIVTVVAALSAVVALSACQRTGFSDLGTARVAPAQPAPLQAQPVGTVQSGQLADPTATAAADPNAFPAAPTGTATMGAGAGNDALAASALDVKKEAMVGNWKAASGGQTCDMFLTLTNLGSGARGGTRGCAGELQAMGSWEVVGKQVLIKDRNGNPIGSVYKTAENRFDGSTNSGQTLSLSR